MNDEDRRNLDRAYLLGFYRGTLEAIASGCANPKERAVDALEQVKELDRATRYQIA